MEFVFDNPMFGISWRAQTRMGDLASCWLRSLDPSGNRSALHAYFRDQVYFIRDLYAPWHSIHKAWHITRSTLQAQTTVRYHVHLNSTDMYLTLLEEPSDNFRRISRECLSFFALETFPWASFHAKALAGLDLVPRTHVLYTAASLEEALLYGPDTWLQLSMDKKDARILRCFKD